MGTIRMIDRIDWWILQETVTWRSRWWTQSSRWEVNVKEISCNNRTPESEIETVISTDLYIKYVIHIYRKSIEWSIFFIYWTISDMLSYSGLNFFRSAEIGAAQKTPMCLYRDNTNCCCFVRVIETHRRVRLWPMWEKGTVDYHMTLQMARR